MNILYLKKSDEGKATIFNSFFKSVFTKEKNAVPDFEPVCETNISKLFFLKAKLKRNCLIWRQTPTTHNLPSRILKELSVRLSAPLRILYTVSFK